MLPVAFGILVRPDLSPGKFADREFSTKFRAGRSNAISESAR